VSTWLLVALLLAEPGRSEGVLPDVALVDHEGREVRLDSELLGGEVVVVNAFFTSCAATCPKVMGRLARVQRMLGARFGREVTFVSLSVDPERDTPERLAAYAKRFGAKPGWRLVSGTQENVDAALRRLGWLVASPESHSAILLVVDERNGTWRRAEGLGKPRDILRVIEDVLRARA
jgi:protein SCO1/2